MLRSVKAALAALCLVLSGSIALAQSQFPSGAVWGNPSASTALPQAATLHAMFDRVFCTTQNAVPKRGAATWGCQTIGTMASQDASNVNITGGTISGVSVSGLSSPREVLTAARVYYVRTDGNDSNTGTANTSGGAWRTLQHAGNYIAKNIDLGGYNVTVQVGAGTYTAGLQMLVPFTGSGNVIFQGDTTTPSNVIIAVPGFAFQATYTGSRYIITGFKIASASTTAGLYASAGGQIYMASPMEFGAIATGTNSAHIFVNSGGSVITVGAYTISGAAYAHFQAFGAGAFIEAISTITLSGTPAITGAFAYANRNGFLDLAQSTYSGSATGTRYVTLNGGGIASGGLTLPGSGAGSATSPGWYN